MHACMSIPGKCECTPVDKCQACSSPSLLRWLCLVELNTSIGIGKFFWVCVDLQNLGPNEFLLRTVYKTATPRYLTHVGAALGIVIQAVTSVVIYILNLTTQYVLGIVIQQACTHGTWTSCNTIRACYWFRCCLKVMITNLTMKIVCMFCLHVQLTCM